MENFFRNDTNIVYLKNQNLDIVSQIKHLVTRSLFLLKKFKYKPATNQILRMNSFLDQIEKKVDRSYQKP